MDEHTIIGKDCLPMPSLAEDLEEALQADFRAMLKAVHRREVDGRVEIWINCPVGCHGFGVCSVCHDLGGYWDRPRPYRDPLGFRRTSPGCF